MRTRWIPWLILATTVAEMRAQQPAATPSQAVIARLASAHDRSAVAERKRIVFDNTPGKAGPRGYDFAKMSDFIHFDGATTFVPKGAVLHVPAALRANIVGSPTGELKLWQAFMAVNRARIATFEITHAQARGTEPIDPTHKDEWKRAGKIVVAVIAGNPTSVATPRPAGTPVTPN